MGGNRGGFMAKILLIEDDLALAGFLRESLENKMHEVDHVADGSEGLLWLRHSKYAAAIVDWQLPGLNGREICRQFRSQGGTTPIIMLTAKNDTPDVVDGLEAGADDYLTKPFQMPELHARLNSLLRRSPTINSRQIKVGDLELDLDTGILRVGTNCTPILTRKEVGILELLMRNPERPFSADAILEHVWSTESVSGTETVRTHVNRLRKHLSAISPDLAEVIESIYGIGYRFNQPRSQK